MIALCMTNRANSKVQNVEDRLWNLKYGGQKQSMRILAGSIA